MSPSEADWLTQGINKLGAFYEPASAYMNANTTKSTEASLSPKLSPQMHSKSSTTQPISIISSVDPENAQPSFKPSGRQLPPMASKNARIPIRSPNATYRPKIGSSMATLASKPETMTLRQTPATKLSSNPPLKRRLSNPLVSETMPSVAPLSPNFGLHRPKINEPDVPAKTHYAVPLSFAEVTKAQTPPIPSKNSLSLLSKNPNLSTKSPAAFSKNPSNSIKSPPASPKSPSNSIKSPPSSIQNSPSEIVFARTRSPALNPLSQLDPSHNPSHSLEGKLKSTKKEKPKPINSEPKSINSEPKTINDKLKPKPINNEPNSTKSQGTNSLHNSASLLETAVSKLAHSLLSEEFGNKNLYY